MGPFGTSREFFFHSLQNYITTMLVESNDFLNVLIQIISFHVSISNTLVKIGGVQVSALFNLHELSQQLVLSSDPAKTQARAEDLGEGAQEHNQALGIQGFQGRQDFALIAQLAIGVILNNGQVVLINNFHKCFTALHGPGTAGGVLEVRNYIDEFAVGSGCQNLVQLFGNQAAVIGGNFHKFRLVSVEGVQSAQVGRAFAEHNVAGVQEQLTNEVQALLGASGNQDIIRVYLSMIFISHAFRNFCAQGGTTFGGCILQQLTTFLQH